ncbi:hypothetical protein [Paenibacillus andongensis]|uniref:hypothetical protein n=1 Tax=Paenibacillus andongensis TaxID=2975482 RepID=UPI0021BB5C23|nr:hypothetical protein [Paenibacillus andongensis]
MNTTSEIIQPIKIFDSFWIDCLSNNLINLLITEDESNKALPFLMKNEYFMTPIKGTYPDMKFDEWHITSGSSCVQVSFTPPYGELIDKFEHVDYKPHHDEDLIGKVEECIKEGYYVFVTVDRFYFPSTLDYKRKHLIHPTLIYGFNSLKNEFYLIDDVIKNGKQDKYVLSYSSFLESTGSVKKTGEIEIGAVRVKKPMMVHDFEERIILDNLRSILEFKIVPDPKYDKDWIYGIDLLLEYSKIMEDVLPLAEDSMRSIFLANQAYQVQFKNLELVNILFEKKRLPDNQLRLHFEKICSKWKAYKYYMILYYEKQKAFDIKKMSGILESLHAMEVEATELFIRQLS